jgi:hypothetical protein
MNEDVIPLVVTLIEEEIHVYEGVPIVPILKLNSFIHESDDHAPGHSFYDYEDILLLADDMLPESDEFSGEGEGEF